MKGPFSQSTTPAFHVEAKDAFAGCGRWRQAPSDRSLDRGGVGLLGRIDGHDQPAVDAEDFVGVSRLVVDAPHIAGCRVEGRHRRGGAERDVNRVAHGHQAFSRMGRHREASDDPASADVGGAAVFSRAPLRHGALP